MEDELCWFEDQGNGLKPVEFFYCPLLSVYVGVWLLGRQLGWRLEELGECSQMKTADNIKQLGCRLKTSC